MAEENNNPLSAYSGDEDSQWALEATQENILKEIQKYVLKNAKSDTEHLKKISKNIEKILKKEDDNSEDEVDILEEIKDNIFESGAQAKKDEQKSQNIFSKGFEILKENKKNRDAISLLGGKSSFNSQLGKITNSLISFDEKGLSKLLVSVPLVGGALGALAGFLGNTIDVYRKLNMIGQNFGTNMISMGRMAGESGMSLEKFSQFIAKNSKIIATVGVQTVADSQKAVRGLLKTVGGLGYSVESLTEFTASYIEQITLAGLFEKMSDDERNKRTAEYIGNLQRLSQLTGKSADEMDRSIRKNMTDLRLQGAMGRMAGAERDRFANIISAVSSSMQRYDDTVQNSINEAMASVGRYSNIAVSELGAAALSIEGLQPAMEAFQRGLRESPEAAQQGLDQLGQALDQLNPQDVQVLDEMIRQGNQGASALMQMMVTRKTQAESESALEEQRQKLMESRIDAMMEARRLDKNDIAERNKIQRELEKQEESSRAATEQFLSLESELGFAIGAFKAAFFDALEGTGMFESMGGAAQFMTEAFKMAGESLGEIVKTFQDFNLKDEGISGFLMRLWDQISMRVGEIMNETDPNTGQSLMDKIINSGMNALESMVELMFSRFGAELALIISGPTIIRIMGSFLSSAMKWLGMMLWTGIKTVAVRAVTMFLLPAIKTAFFALLGLIGGIPLAIGAAITGLIALVAGIFYWDEIKSWFPSVDDIGKIFGDLFSLDKWKEWASSLYDSVTGWLFGNSKSSASSSSTNTGNQVNTASSSTNAPINSSAGVQFTGKFDVEKFNRSQADILSIMSDVRETLKNHSRYYTQMDSKLEKQNIYLESIALNTGETVDGIDNLRLVQKMTGRLS